MTKTRRLTKQFFCMMGVVGFAFVANSAQALVISASGTNTSIYDAQNLDPYFSLDYKHNIESSQVLELDDSVTVTNESTSLPHVTIEANVTTDQELFYAPPHFYSFHATAGARGIFDIDYAASNFLFLDMWLFDSAFNPVESFGNYSGGISLMGPGEVDDINAPFSLNPFFDLTFGSTDTYYLGIGEWDFDINDGYVDPLDPDFGLAFLFDGDYTLHVSIEDHAVAAPEPSTLLLMGAGLIGLGFMRRRKSDDAQ